MPEITCRIMINLDFRRLTSLLVLNIDFTPLDDSFGVLGNFPHKCLENLAINLLSLQSLSVFNFTYLSLNHQSVCTSSPTGVESLCLSLKELKFLTTLGLNLPIRRHSDENKTPFITDLNIQNIASLISSKNLHKMSTLTLNLLNWHHRITDSTTIYLSNALKSLTSLKALNLILFDCIDVLYSAFEDLSRSTYHFTTLESLNLRLRDCGTSCASKLTERLCTTLAHLVNLKSLCLKFQSCSAKRINTLFEGLKRLDLLKTLSINFHNFMTASDVINLSNALKYLSQLENFSLNIKGSSKVTNKSVEALCESLKHLKSLKSLSVDITGCNSLTEKSLDSLSETLIQIPFLLNLDILAGS